MKKSMLVGIRSLFPGVLIAVGSLRGAFAADLHVPNEYATIQAAVDAASSGDTIRLAAGNYYEQVVIVDKSNLTLAGEPGEPGSVMRPFSGMTPKGPSVGLTNSAAHNNAVTILLTLRSQVVLTNLTLDGAGLGDLYPEWLWGVFFVGSSARIENCTINRFRGATQTQSRGITSGNRVAEGPGVVNLSVLNSRLIDNMRSILVAGDPDAPAVLRTTFTIEGNTFVGYGPAPTMLHVGLSVLSGAAGEVRGNTMTGFSYGGGTPGSCAAIRHYDSFYLSRGFFPGQPIRYQGNTFSNNDDHLVLFTANNSRIVNNVFHGAGPGNRWGGLDVSGTNIVIANNNFSGMPTGTVLFGNDAYFDGRLIPPASNVSLNDNWFCDVATPVTIRSGATDIQERGTQTCPFRPMLQSIARDGSSASLGLRSWHGQPVVVETSTDLLNWSPIYTNMMALPRIEYLHGNGAADPRRFYRAVQE